LRDGVTRANHSDFVDEFEVYRQRLPNSILALANLNLSDYLAEVCVASSPHAQPTLRFAHTASLLRQIPHSSAAYGPWFASRAIYLPLESGTMLTPLRHDGSFWNVRDVHQLLTYCSELNRERLAQLITGLSHECEYLIVQLPRPSGGAALFGIRFTGISGQHPLTYGGDAMQLTPITIIRRDKPYLAQRGGGHMEVTDKRILLCSCGAIGGHLAWELSRAGVEQLTLVDSDILAPHNTYRHVLGKSSWGKQKTLALAQEIRRQIPFSRIRALTETIETTIAHHHINVNEYDLIVSALGNPTSELALNEHVRRLDSEPPIVFTWLDPYGIGGHAVLTGMHGRSGCFECLYTQSDSSYSLHNRAAFAAPGQVFHRALAGCDSLYTPYGSLDAAQTAQLAARLALDVLIDREQQNRLCSWKGNAVSFTAEGFALVMDPLDWTDPNVW
jgi:molybdopterin/thiamine biosynthesis adenylyltransferase